MANRILELEQQKTAKLDAAKAILAKAETEKRAVLTTEEQTSFDALHQEAEGIVATITREQRMAAAGNAYSDAAPRTGVNVQVHDNILEKPWGPEAKAGETAAQRGRRLQAGFGEYLSAVRHGTLSRADGRPVDPRLLALNDGYEKRASAAGASEMVPSDGGFLIAPDFSNEILQLSHATGLVHPLTRKLPLSEFTNAIKIPAIDEQSRKDGFRWGGVQAFWENEAQQFVGSKPTFALLEMLTKKLTALYYATNEVLADARLLGAIAMQAFAEEIGFKLDDGVIRGTGSGQLAGILNANALITVAKVSGQGAQTIVPQNIWSMWGRLWNRSRKNAVWLINQDIEQQLNGLNSQGVGSSTNTSGIPIYLPPGVGVFGGLGGTPLAGSESDFGANAGTLLGRPVISIEQACTLGTPGDIMLVDLAQYLMIDKGDLQTAQSSHVRFITDEQTFRFVQRVDGAPWWKVAVQPAQGSNTLSPFVVLAQR